MAGVLEHPDINVMWNRTVVRFEGRAPTEEEEEEDAGLTGLLLRSTESEVEELLDADAAFVAIGHDPNTAIFRDGPLAMDDLKDGYISVKGYSTVTNVPGQHHLEARDTRIEFDSSIRCRCDTIKIYPIEQFCPFITLP
jgi:thioredoxin reductase